ncbi:MAG: oligosaccharide flippase family protein [Anaerolineae bacterium]|nr:oligosaccharide flippase family protein [Anaerolineae bacterium]
MFADNSAKEPTELQSPVTTSGLGPLARTAGVTGISSLFAQGVGYAMVLLLTLSLGADGFGLFSLVTTVKGILVLVGSLSMGVTTVRFAAWYRGKGNLVGLQKLLSAVTWGTLIWSSVVSLILWSLSPTIAETIFHRPEMALALRLVVWVIPLDVLFNVWISGLHGLGLTTKRAYLEQILLPLARLIAVGVSFGVGPNVETVLVLMNVASGVSMLVAGWLLGRNVQFWKISPITSSDWRSWIKYTVPTFLDALLVTSLGGSLEVLLLGVFATDTIVGVYSAVLRLRFIFKMPMTAFNNALAPLISESYARKDIQYLGSLFRSTTRWTIMICGPLAIIFGLFGRSILNIFGSEFTVGYTALLIITMGELVNVFVGPVGHILLMTGYSRIRLFNSLVLSGEQLILGLLLIPQWQLIGASWVGGVSIATVSILGLLEVRALLHLHPYQIDLCKPISICILSTAAVIIIQSLLGQDGAWWQALLGMLFCGSYVGLLLKFGLTDEDRDLINRFFRRVSFKS